MATLCAACGNSVADVDGNLVSGQKSGYIFNLSNCSPGDGGAIVKYEVVAVVVSIYLQEELNVLPAMWCE